MRRLAVVIFAATLLIPDAASAQARRPAAPAGLDGALDQMMGAEAKPAAQKPKGGTVKLTGRKDKLTLRDGTVIEGSLVAVGSKAIVIVTAEGERTVPRHEVVRIVRGRPDVEPLLPRTYETEVVDGHEHIVVPPGLEDEDGGAPPGIIEGIVEKPEPEKNIELRYTPKKGDTLSATLVISTSEVEDLPGKERVLREAKRTVHVTQAVSGVTAAGAWTVDAAYKVLGAVRDHRDVTALEAKGVEGVRLTRSLSAAGVWQPGADRLTGAPEGNRSFAQWLGYLTVPLPPRPVPFGSVAKTEDLIPAGIARLMLPPPGHVDLPNWRVTGKYTVKGTGTVAGTRCAIIVIELQGFGAGDGMYAGTRAKLDVKASSRWDVDFAVAEGRAVRGAVETTTLTTGQIGNDPLQCKTTAKVAVDATAPVQRAPAPKKPGAPTKPPTGNLDKALDDLMKQINAPDFFK